MFSRYYVPVRRHDPTDPRRVAAARDTLAKVADMRRLRERALADLRAFADGADAACNVTLPSDESAFDVADGSTFTSATLRCAFDMIAHDDSDGATLAAFALAVHLCAGSVESATRVGVMVGGMHAAAMSPREAASAVVTFATRTGRALVREARRCVDALDGAKGGAA